MAHVETTEAKIRDILCRECGLDNDQITSNAHLIHDLGCDSIDQMEVVMACEEEFNVEINDEEVAEIETFQQLVAYIERLRKL